MQTRLRQFTIPKQKIDEFQSLVQDIMRKLREEGISENGIDRLILKGEQLEKVHTRLRRSPEEVTKELIIEPLFDFLGYDKKGKSSGSASSKDQKAVDYTLEIAFNEYVLAEAEPLNKELKKKKGQGVEQLKDYLYIKSARSNLGIATNGFNWILTRYDTNTHSFKEIHSLDIKPFFLQFKQQSFADLDEILKEFYLFFSRDHIVTESDATSRLYEEEKEKITNRFYDDYIKYVFGIEKEAKKKGAKNKSLQVRTMSRECLLNSLRVPKNAGEKSKRLFVITLMSRLIFIKFLEDKKLVKPRLLRSLLQTHRDSNVLTSFYHTYLQPLFYDVLNTPRGDRKPKVVQISEYNSIPYLNGGLFREVVADEMQYDVEDKILELIIETLEKYNFTLEDNPESLNPDILGLVFEKTINHLTGEKHDRRKKLGAYYTPDDVTTYISKETIPIKTLELIKDYLREIGWNEIEINNYTSLDDFFNSPPKNPKFMKAIYDRVSRMTVLDPACGSGHFLASALKELFLIRKSLLPHFQNKFSNYQIKREIVTKNLYGVDIENTAVEIARLQLWLSMIEDLDVDLRNREIETLPNIEYNIEEGNSWLGFTTPVVLQTGLDDDVSIESIFKEIDELKTTFRQNPDPKKTKELKILIDEKISTFEVLLNKKLAANLTTKNVHTSADAITAMKPFHWRLRFSDVFAQNGGFDIIVGNPPYVEKRELSYPTESLMTDECESTYAYCFEISLQILKADGYIGFIVPISSICTDRMIPLQRLLRDSCSLLHISNFDDRPAKLFQGLEDCRSSIIIGKKKEKPESEVQVFTTKYNRWVSEERDKLFKELKFINSTKAIVDGIIPKIGSELELELLLRLREESPLGNYFVKSGLQSQTIWYHNTPRYWVRAMDFIPKFEGSDDETISSKVKKIYVNDPKNRQLVIPILNSSLFYWYFVVCSNCRDLVTRELTGLNIDLDRMSTENKASLRRYCSELMEDLKRNSKIKKMKRKTGNIVLQEFYPRYSKRIIDKIDEVLAQHYGFTESQLKFIKSFDERFRMGEEELATKPLVST